MKRDVYESPFDLLHSNNPYSLALATAASASSGSVWSDASSQHSDDSSASSATSRSDSCDSYCFSQPEPSSQSSVSSVESACEPVSKLLGTKPKQCLPSAHVELSQEH